MRRLLTAALIFAALGPMPGTVMRFPEADLTESAAARPIAFVPSTSGMVRFVRGWPLVSPHRRFGGFSPIARTGPDRFPLVGDNGYGPRRTPDTRGPISAVAIRPLPTTDGRPARKPLITSQSRF